MSLFFIKSNTQIGNYPGTLDFIGNKKVADTTFSIISYNKEDIKEESGTEINLDDLSDNYIHWINVYGLHDVEKINKVCLKFNIGQLTVEDILNTSHIPKYEEYEDYKIFILKIIRYDYNTKSVVVEQISILILKNTVICFQELPIGVFNKLRERIRMTIGRIRKRKAVYLFYAIMDIVVENYLNEVSKIGIEIEDAGKLIFSDNNTKIEQKLYNLKIETGHLRMQIFPVKDLIIKVLKSEYSYVDKATKPFFYDLIEISTQVNNNIELCNLLINDQINTYNTLVSNKMNEIMKVLTIFASIFIPLTFLAGIYGMNFEYIPELKYKYSYPIFWLLIIIVVVSLVIFFKKKKWL